MSISIPTQSIFSVVVTEKTPTRSGTTNLIIGTKLRVIYQNSALPAIDADNAGVLA
ncbi:hypothetical protein LCGC14_1497190, partial [marine sediment metagenome]